MAGTTDSSNRMIRLWLRSWNSRESVRRHLAPGANDPAKVASGAPVDERTARNICPEHRQASTVLVLQLHFEDVGVGDDAETAPEPRSRGRFREPSLPGRPGRQERWPGSSASCRARRGSSFRRGCWPRAANSPATSLRSGLGHYCRTPARSSTPGWSHRQAGCGAGGPSPSLSALPSRPCQADGRKFHVCSRSTTHPRTPHRFSDGLARSHQADLGFGRGREARDKYSQS